MKKILVVGALMTAGCLIPEKLCAQVVVAIKPVAPKAIILKPRSARLHTLWVAGHWKWNHRKKRYEWEKGALATASPAPTRPIREERL